MIRGVDARDASSGQIDSTTFFSTYLTYPSLDSYLYVLLYLYIFLVLPVVVTCSKDHVRGEKPGGLNFWREDSISFFEVPGVAHPLLS